MKRDLTEFIFFKDTPNTQFNEVIFFKDFQERDDYYLRGNHFRQLLLTHDNFNYIRDKSTLDINVPYEKIQGINYCTFYSEKEERRFFAYVTQYEYINENVTRMYLLIDGITTYLNAEILNEQSNLNIERQHLTKGEYLHHLKQLKNNNDVLQTSTNAYIKEYGFTFKKYDVIIQSAVSLIHDFGDTDNPKMETSSGVVFDSITSPLDLYVVKLEHFNDFMQALAPYPWIAQNIKSILLVPSDFLSGQYQPATMNNGKFNKLNVITGKNSYGQSFSKQLEKISFNMQQLYEAFGLEENEKHLARSGYATAELYNYDGSQLLIDLGKLNEKIGLHFRHLQVLGHKNVIAVYVDRYNTNEYSINDDVDNNRRFDGTFLNQSLTFEHFDNLPVLIDNYNLSLASSANQRKLNESRLITNRLQNIVNPDSDFTSKFYDVASVASNLNPYQLFGKFNEEYEYYREKKAQQADLKLQAPTISEYSNDNALAIANKFYGLRLKLSFISGNELEDIKRYYKKYGFEVNRFNASLSNVRSQTVCNFVKFTGRLKIKGADVNLLRQTELLFENGVTLYHNNHTSDPITRNLYNNTFRE